MTEEGHDAQTISAEEACARADIIVTATTAQADTPPLFEAEWVCPGTRISRMGADAPRQAGAPARTVRPRPRLLGSPRTGPAHG
ncbi:hypothetical protein [Streptomyces griseoluteus]|uniref:hypothetical protein n=1 Tax=Streptomyces griseoluteus TaxID=29306 RepID=UPI0036B8C165